MNVSEWHKCNRIFGESTYFVGFPSEIVSNRIADVCVSNLMSIFENSDIKSMTLSEVIESVKRVISYYDIEVNH